jgi:hypothetical protein
MMAIPDVGPDSALARMGQAPVQNFHRRVVGPDYFGSQHKVFQPRIQRIEQIRRLPHPAAERLVGKIHAPAPKHFRLPV